MNAVLEQLSLFHVPPEAPATITAPYVSTSATSQEAAEAILPHLGRLQRQVLVLFAAAGADGLTDWEIEQDTGMNPSTIRPRRVELAQAGCIRQAEGQRRPTGSGRQAQVWQITPAGLARLEDAE